VHVRWLHLNSRLVQAVEDGSMVFDRIALATQTLVGAGVRSAHVGAGPADIAMDGAGGPPTDADVAATLTAHARERHRSKMYSICQQASKALGEMADKAHAERLAAGFLEQIQLINRSDGVQVAPSRKKGEKKSKALNKRKKSPASVEATSATTRSSKQARAAV